MGLTPRQVAEKLTPSEYMTLCERAAVQYGKDFDILSVDRTHGVRVQLEVDKRKVTVEL
jgi:hypothetical protein